ncbi:MAG TPA: hypothetical protein VHN99_00985, partial [Deinococcales bacterium]|nr:hypothetical protein [Deinococcales bacterium]
GLYEGSDGIRRYVKIYADEAQARGEALANELYRALGLEAPKSLVLPHAGKWLHATELVANSGTLGAAGLDTVKARQVLQGFAADVLTANWDAVGLSLDNVVLTPTGVARIDQGGAFLMRAKAGRKPASALNAISEWAGFAPSGVNPAYAKVFQAAGVNGPVELGDEMLKQLDAIKALGAGGWDAVLTRHAPGWTGPDRDAVLKMLESRAKLLEAKRAEIQAWQKAQAAAAQARAAAIANGQFVLDHNDPVFQAFLKQIDARAGDDLDDIIGPLDKAAGLKVSERKTIKAFVRKWTGEYATGPAHLESYDAWQAITTGKKPAPGKYGSATVVTTGAATRAARWDALAKRMGLPMRPTSFRLHRGSKGEPSVEDVLRAWLGNQPHVTVRQHALASWSTRHNTAAGFSRDHAGTGVVYSGDIDFRQTVLDRYVDDSGFQSTSFYTEYEVIVATDTTGRVLVPHQECEVWFKHTRYTYADRDALKKAWLAAGKTL